MTKIFHTADLHLGMAFNGYGEKASTLSEARYKTLDHLVELANKHEADIFVVAGDLFDKLSGINLSDIKRVVGSLNRFSGSQVLVLPGNHDFIADQGTFWPKIKEAASDKVMLLEHTSPVKLSGFEVEIVVYPGPCRSKHSNENAIGWIGEVDKDPNALHIGIAHGSVEGKSPDLQGNYFPMGEKQIKETGLDVLLLGHTHVTFPDKPGPKDRYFNPGTPEPDGLNCTHEGRAFLHLFEGKQRKETKVLSTGTFRFYDMAENVESIADLERIRKTWTTEAHRTSVVRLRLNGHLSLEDWNRTQDLRAALQSHVAHLQLELDGLRKRISPEMIRNEFAEHSFAYNLLDRLKDDEEALQLAYEWITEVRQ